MGLLLGLGYMISSLFGVGVLLLPSLLQQVGVINFFLGLTSMAFLLLFSAYIVLELIEVANSNVEEAVRTILGKWGIFSTSLHGVFTYSALTAYVLAAGDQLAAWLGGDPHYWSAFFFVLAVIPALGGLNLAALTVTYLSMFLIAMVLFVIPVNLNFASIPVPVSGTFFSFPLFLTIAAFALAGHFSVYELHKLVKDETSNIRIFFAAFGFSFLVYALYSVTAAGVGKMADLSSSTLAQVYPPFYSLLISIVALLAFYTSFVAVSHSFVKMFERKAPKRAIYALMLIPIALLYMAVREYHVFTLINLVGRIGGVSLLWFLALASFAHYKAAKRWKTRIPKPLSGFVGVSLFLIGLIGLFA